MSVYKIYPSQDSTLYTINSSQNTGLDEIIEASLDVGDLVNPNPQSSRFLIQFAQNDILDIINNKIQSKQWQSNLRCFIADASSMVANTTVDIFPVSQSWSMGTGRFSDNPQTQNGASWVYRDTQGGQLWISGSFNSGTTGSYTGSVDTGGGTWYITQSWSGSQIFGFYDNKDINVNATNIVSAWYSGSIPNNGFIVKQDVEFINDLNQQPKLKYFSIDTHTIYPPCLEFKWKDSTISTGSLSFISTNPFEVSFGNNPGFFYSGSINKFRVLARPTYPTRIFTTSSIYTQNYYLPTSSFYAIKDLDTNEYVVDFDTTYTQLSIDSTSSYFTLYMNGLQTERYYSILIQTVVDGSTIILNNDYHFKIING